MKAENVDVLIARLGTEIVACKAAIMFLRKYQAAGEVMTLGAEQKAEAMNTVGGMASAISGAYSEVVEAFTTDEVIDTTPDPDPIPPE